MTRNSLVLDAVGVVLFGAALALDHWAPGQVPGIVRGLLYGLGAGAIVGSLLFVRFSNTCDMSTPTQRRRYLREVTPVAIGYTAAVIGSVFLLRHIDAPALRAAVALLPVPFVALLLRAIVRYIRDADELQRRIEVEAVSFAAAFVSLVYFGAGLLQVAKVIDVPSGVAMIWVFPMLSITYGIAKLFVSRRYG